tara:strand:- start:250 stop:774 length:525 start_codon:yes stop_codon:yes gene_type:complete
MKPLKLIKMRKIIYLTVCVFTLFVGCSKSDDADEETDKPKETGDISMRVNGEGFSDTTFEMFRETVGASDGKIRFSAKDDDNNTIDFYLPDPVEKLQYSIAPYVFGNVQTSSVILNKKGIYLSKDGNAYVTDITVNGQCKTYKGSININYRRQDNAPGALNIQGKFDISIDGCD